MLCDNVVGRQQAHDAKDAIQDVHDLDDVDLSGSKDGVFPQCFAGPSNNLPKAYSKTVACN